MATANATSARVFWKFLTIIISASLYPPSVASCVAAQCIRVCIGVNPLDGVISDRKGLISPMTVSFTGLSVEQTLQGGAANIELSCGLTP